MIKSQAHEIYRVALQNDRISFSKFIMQVAFWGYFSALFIENQVEEKIHFFALLIFQYYFAMLIKYNRSLIA